MPATPFASLTMQHRGGPGLQRHIGHFPRHIRSRREHLNALLNTARCEKDSSEENERACG